VISVIALMVASAIGVSGCGGGGGNGGGVNAGPLAGRFPGEAVFTEVNETSQARDQIEKCGFTDSEDKRRQFIQAPASEPTGLKLIENHDASGKLVGTLEVAQRVPGVYVTSCTLPGERPEIPHSPGG
jgi:hypothetical protein